MGSVNPLGYLGIKETNPPEIHVSQRVPTAADIHFDIGDIWINEAALTSYQLMSKTGGSAVWGIITPGSSDVDTVNGLPPVAGNIVVSGGTNLTDVNAGNTVTLNLDPAITLATSVTSPIYASAAAMAINPVGALTVTGGAAVAIDAVGVLELNSSTGVIGIGNDAVAQNINVGTGAAARVITIGNGTGATSVVVDSGTGAASFAANATAHTTTVGSTTGASATVIQSGTGKITLTGTVKELTADFATVSGTDITFSQSPIMQSALNTGVAPTGATGDVNLMYFQDGETMEEFIIGGGQTIIAPRMDASGLLVSLDLTATEGAEYNWGALSNAKHAFTVGTTADYQFTASIKVADVTGAEPMLMGFRKVEANNGTYTAYTDYAAIGLNNAVNPGTIIIEDRLNSGAAVQTNTTDAWADGETHILRMNVSQAGVVTYTIDGVAPTATHAFTFDNGDVIMPFFHFVHGAAAPGAIHWVSMTCGHQ